MWKTFRKVCSEWRDSIELARPASTLLLATVAMLLVALAAPALPAQPAEAEFGAVWVSEEVPPGGTIRIAVEGAGTAAYTAYLPGLSNTRLRLTYDARTGFHSGRIEVPTGAPGQGYCTVRVINSANLEEDHRVRLLPNAKMLRSP